jgi:hypothetical protein
MQTLFMFIHAEHADENAQTQALRLISAANVTLITK